MTYNFAMDVSLVTLASPPTLQWGQKLQIIKKKTEELRALSFKEHNGDVFKLWEKLGYW